MKWLHIALVALCICSLAVSACAEPPISGEQQALYEAVSNVDFHVRKTPDEKARRISEVLKGETLRVYEYTEQWCKVQYDNEIGYCKTKWLYLFRSLQPGKAAVPGYLAQTGIARVLTPVHVLVRGYDGNTLSEGDLISIHQWDQANAAIHMMKRASNLNGLRALLI